MTDTQQLFKYRMTQAKETLMDAKKMLSQDLGPRSIINRAYYAMFYAILALFLKSNVSLKTSKHAGVISIFDKEFVHTGKFDKRYSKSLHRIFDARLESDYKEMVDVAKADAVEAVNISKDFLKSVVEYTKE